MRIVKAENAILVYSCPICSYATEQTGDSLVKSGTVCPECDCDMVFDSFKFDDDDTISATLTAIYSKRDHAGNCYWALKFVDHATGKVVVGKSGGGEGNIYAIRRIWNPELDDWDRSIQFCTEEMPIRKFNRLTKDWKYAGSGPEELADFIRDELAK